MDSSIGMDAAIADHRVTTRAAPPAIASMAGMRPRGRAMAVTASPVMPSTTSTTDLSRSPDSDHIRSQAACLGMTL